LTLPGRTYQGVQAVYPFRRFRIIRFFHHYVFGFLGIYQFFDRVNDCGVKITFMLSDKLELLVLIAKIWLKVPCDLDADKNKNQNPKPENNDPDLRVNVFFLAREFQRIDDHFHAENSCN
jgi:hypothetical protein